MLLDELVLYSGWLAKYPAIFVRVYSSSSVRWSQDAVLVFPFGSLSAHHPFASQDRGWPLFYPLIETVLGYSQSCQKLKQRCPSVYHWADCRILKFLTVLLVVHKSSSCTQVIARVCLWFSIHYKPTYAKSDTSNLSTSLNQSQNGQRYYHYTPYSNYHRIQIPTNIPAFQNPKNHHLA